MKTIFLLLISISSFAQITYFGSASNPADNGNTTGASVLAITPPGSMTAGDLVVVTAQTSNTNANVTSIVVSTTGGQTWSNTGYIGGASSAPTCVIFWCRYNGTWGANPDFTFTVTTPINSVVMHVFRPSVSSRLWALGSSTTNGITDNAAPYVGTITGLTTLFPATVSLAMWPTGGNPTWGSLSGSGWVVTGSAQYRNLSGTDQTNTFAHYIQTTVGATGNVSKTASGVINLTGAIHVFYEYYATPFTILDN